MEYDALYETGGRFKFGNWVTVPSLYNWNIAECDVKSQQTNEPTNIFKWNIVECDD